jgi:hypothetical protein
MQSLLLVARFVAGLSMVAVLQGCNHFKTTRHACFAQAEAIATNVDKPVVLDAAALPADLPSFVPYAIVFGDFHAGGPEYQADFLRHHVHRQGMRPDFLIYQNGGAGYAGQVTQFVGYGMAMSQPVYRPQGLVHCCRVAPAKMGLRFDDKAMVTDILDSQRVSGIQEGDTILNIDGKTVDTANGTLSEYRMASLGFSVGQEVKVVWIRPGTGRMEGVIRLIPNTEMPTGLVSMTAMFDRQ